MNIDKTQLDYEISKIESDEIKGFVNKMLQNVPDYFWDSNFKASSSGKYHLEINGEVESLIDHTKRVFKVSRVFIEHPLFSNFFVENDDKDCLMAACLLHDSIKRGFDLSDLNHTKFEHPLYPSVLARNIFDSEILSKPYVKKILKLVESHSGSWNKSSRSEIELPMPVTFLELICHICDYFASRKGIYISLE